MEKLIRLLTCKPFALVAAFTLSLIWGWEAGAATMLIGLNTELGGEGGEGGDAGDTALGGEGGEGGDGGGGEGGSEGSWTEGLPDEVKAFFGEAKSLDEFKAGLPKAAEVPEDYAYAVPEGTEGVDSEAVAAFSTFAKENNLQISQGDFEKLMAFDQQRMQDMPSQILEQVNAEMLEGLDAMKTEMGEEQFGATIGMAKKVIKAFGGDDVKEWLNETKMGNHPVLVKFLSKIGKGLSEDQFSGGDGGSGGETKTPAQRLYPNQGKK